MYTIKPLSHSIHVIYTVILVKFCRIQVHQEHNIHDDRADATRYEWCDELHHAISNGWCVTGYDGHIALLVGINYLGEIPIIL